MQSIGHWVYPIKMDLHLGTEIKSSLLHFTYAICKLLFFIPGFDSEYLHMVTLSGANALTLMIAVVILFSFVPAGTRWIRNSYSLGAGSSLVCSPVFKS